MLSKKIASIAAILALVSHHVSYAQSLSEYLEVKQVYQDRGIIAVTANTTIKFSNSVSVMNNGTVCDLPIDSRNGNYIFIKAQPCLTTDKLVAGNRIEIALLQSEKPLVEVKNASSELKESDYDSRQASNPGYLDFQLREKAILIKANLINETEEYTLKFAKTSIGSISSKSTALQLGAGVGISNKTSVEGSIRVPVNIKSTTVIENVGTFESKTDDVSDPFLSLQHRFVEGINYGNWTPILLFNVGTKLADAEVTDDFDSMRRGGWEIDLFGGATKRLENSIVGFIAGYKAPLERTVNNVDSGSTSVSEGGENLVFQAGWQHLTGNRSSFGIAGAIEFVSSTDSTNTTSQSVKTKSSISNYTRTSLSAFGAVSVTDSTTLDLSYNIALPYDFSQKISNIELDVSSDKDYRISVGLSHQLEL